MNNIQVRKRLTFLLSIIALVAIVIGVSRIVSYSYLDRADKKESQSYQISQGIRDLMISLINTEVGQRTYLYTGKKEYLDQYENEKMKFSSYLKDLKSLLRDDPEQLRKLQDLGVVSAQRLARADETINLLTSGKTDLALAAVASGKGKKLMEIYKTVSVEMLNAEELRIANLKSDTKRAMDKFASITVAGQVISFSCAMLALYFLFKI